MPLFMPSNNQYGVFNVRSPFGATGNDTTDDSAAFQNAINAARALPTGGVVEIPPGLYKIASTIDCYPSVPLELYFHTGAKIRNAVTGTAGVCFSATNPTTPSTRGSPLRIVNPWFEMHSSVGGGTIGSVHFEHRYATDLSFIGRGFFSHYRNNTNIRLSAPWNVYMGATSVWGGGFGYYRKTTAQTFSIATGTTNLSASGAVFDSSDVGRSIILQGTPVQYFTIASVTDGQNAVTNETATGSLSNAGGVFDAIKGTVSGGTTVTLEASVAQASDIGRSVYILDAHTAFGTGTPEIAHRAVISGVPSGNTLTLSVAADLSPSNVYVLFSPDVEIYAETNSAPNDITWYNLQQEQFRGVGLAISGAVNCRFTLHKLHGLNGIYTSAATIMALLITNSGSVIFENVDIEGIYNNSLAPVHISGTTSGVFFTDVLAVVPVRQALVYKSNLLSASRVAIQNVSIANTFHSAATLDPAALFQGTANGMFDIDGITCAYNAVADIPKSQQFLSSLAVNDGVAAPAAVLGRAQIYVDTIDGDLKVKFGDGVVKTIATGV